MSGNEPSAGGFGAVEPGPTGIVEHPREHAPPAGGFGAPAVGQPTEIEHREATPPQPSNALHTIFIAVSCIVLLMLIVVGLGEWKKAKDSRGAEAMVTLHDISKGVATTYEATGQLCPSGRPIPGDFEQVRGKRYRSRPEEWNDDPGWSCAGFAMTSPQRYQYRLETTGSFVTIVAAGDFDGDDLRATYELHGHVDPERRRIVFDGALRESNPGE